MLNTEQINDLHRLYWSERWSIQMIERHLKMGSRTLRKYLKAPAQGLSLASCALSVVNLTGALRSRADNRRRLRE